MKELDLQGLRPLMVKLEKAIHTNVEMRAKYQDKPEKCVSLLFLPLVCPFSEAHCICCTGLWSPKSHCTMRLWRCNRMSAF